MDSTHRPARRLKEALLAIAVGVILFGGLLRLDRPVDREALTRDAVAAHLLAGETVGRQALVGSVWWAPLPTLMLVPLRYGVRWLPAGAAALLFACLSVVLAGWTLYRFARIRLSRWESVYLVVALALMPGMLDAIAGGVVYAWCLMLTIALTAAYAGWRHEHSLRALVLFGTIGGMIAASSVVLLSWGVLMIGLLTVHELARPALAAEKRAVLLLAALPGLYMAGLWVLMNWLLMGDPVYFLRTWRAVMPQDIVTAGLPTAWMPLMAGLLVYLLLLAGVAMLTRRGAALCMAAAAVLWVGPILRFAHLDLVEARLGAVWSMAAGAIMATAALAGSFDRRFSRIRWVICLAAPVLALVLRSSLVAPPSPGPTATAVADRQTLLQAVRLHVTDPLHPHVKVFVAGFEGLYLLSGVHDATFVPVLDFDVDQVATDYPGYRLYLLVRRPDGAAALDGIHVKYPGVYRRGGPRSLYDRDWGSWRLFEVSGRPE